MSALASVLAVLAVYLAGTALVLSFFYLMPRPRSLAWPRRARKTVSFLTEYGAAVVTEVLIPLFQFFWPWWWHLRRGHPVILVHGYGQNRADFFWMALSLRRRVQGPLVGVNYWYMASVRHCARRIGQVVERWARRSPTGKVDLVCHSFGGIVARYCVEQMDGAEHVRQIITIASPHRGTWWARGGLGRSSRQMSPGDPFVQAFRYPSPPEPVRYRAVWSRADAVVTPPSSASLMGAGTETAHDHLGHLSLLLAPSVIDQVARWIRDNP